MKRREFIKAGVVVPAMVVPVLALPGFHFEGPFELDYGFWLAMHLVRGDGTILAMKFPVLAYARANGVTRGEAREVALRTLKEGLIEQELAPRFST